MNVAPVRQPEQNQGSMWDDVDAALEQAVYREQESPSPEIKGSRDASAPHWVAPGATLLVGHRGEVVYWRGFGSRSIVPEVTPLTADMVFDVASLTKAIVTTTLAMQLVDRGQLDIDRRVSRIIQTFSSHGKERITVRHLLSHCSGFPATAPFFRLISRAHDGERAGIMTSRGAVEFVYREILRSKPEQTAGKVAKYSDIGFILLGHIIETLNGGHYLDKLAQRDIFNPLQLRSTGFVELAKLKRRGLTPVTDIIVPTLQCPWRGKVLCGEVHDDNAWAMGGIAGHAGLFSTAEDIHTFAAEMIDCYHGRGSLVSQNTVRDFWKIDGTVSGSTWGLGWDTPTAGASSSGSYFSPNSVGHLAFTGCSLWIDPEREVDVVLLTNRIHPTADNNRIREFRPKIHDLVMTALGYDH